MLEDVFITAFAVEYKTSISCAITAESLIDLVRHVVGNVMSGKIARPAGFKDFLDGNRRVYLLEGNCKPPLLVVEKDSRGPLA